jgi:hypothetical protein
MKLRLLAVVFVGVTLLGPMAVASGASSSKTPYAQMRTVIADANAQRSVRLTTTATMSGLKIVEVTDAGRSAGRQSITLTKLGYANTVKIELIAGKLYVKGDASILTSYLALPQATANELAGQWFGIPKSSGYYAQVADGMTISTALAEVTMTNAVASEPAVMLDGALVDVLKGTSVKSTLEPSFDESLFVSTAKRPLPVEVTQVVQGSLGTIVFSHWDEMIVLSAPRVSLHLN